MRCDLLPWALDFDFLLSLVMMLRFIMALALFLILFLIKDVSNYLIYIL